MRFGGITVLLCVALATLVAAGCGSARSTASTDSRAAGQPARRAFDASFVPGDATWLLILQLDGRRMDRLRRAGERIAGWPLVESHVPTRRGSIDALLARAGLASTGDSSLAWIGAEAGGAILPGNEPGWLVWADVRSGRGRAARAAVDDILRRTSRSSGMEVEERDGRILLANSSATLERVHEARDGRAPYSDRREWKELAPERARSTSIVALFGREGGGILGADSRGIRFAGKSSNRRCEDYPAGNAFAELAKRTAGPAIQRASSDGITADATRLVADRAFVREVVSLLMVAAQTESRGNLRAGVERLQRAIDTLDLAKPAPHAGIRMVDDPAYSSALDAVGDVPGDAGVVYWIDAGRLTHELVARARAQGQLGRTEAAIASGAADGMDGVLLWVHTSGTRDCMADIGMRISIPTD